MSNTIKEIESKEPDKQEIQKKLKENIMTIYNQIKTGCSRKYCYNIYCKNNAYCRQKFQNAKQKQIIQELIKVNGELNKESKTYDHLDLMKCINEEDILQLEKKLNSFLLDANYDFCTEIIENKPRLPKINIDLSKIVIYFKNTNEDKSDKKILEELRTMNKYFQELTPVKSKSIDSIKDKCISYYLFQLMSQYLFYLLTYPDICVNRDTVKDYLLFFENIIKINKMAKLFYLKTLKNNSMDIEENDETKKILETELEESYKNSLAEAFESVKNYPNEFSDIIYKCQSFLTIILYTVGGGEEEELPLDKDFNKLLEIFVICFDVLNITNKKYKIVEDKLFYNKEISKHIDLKRQFRIFLINKRIEEKKEKKDTNPNNTNNQNNNNNQNIDNNDLDDELDEDEESMNLNDNNNLEPKFTLLNYTWLFNESAKYDIINIFNERKQHDELINSVRRGVDIGNLGLFGLGRLIPAKVIFFILEIRRDNIIEDTLNQVVKPGAKLRNPLKVKFRGEQGIDEGGVRKEFFMLLTRQIFDANYGMFSYNKKTRLFWFNLYSFESKMKYELIGIILGLAIFNGIILDIKFPLAVYKKLLGVKTTILDMKECDPELYNTLTFLLDTKDKDIKEKLDMNFVAVADKFGEKIVVPLKEDGENIMIDYNNKNEYVNLFLDWYFNKSIEEYFKSFEIGFFRVFDKTLSKILSPEELELIICGTQYLDFNALKDAVRYEDGYTKDSQTIQDFWEILLSFNEEEKKKFLFFVTGCDRAPIDGLGNLMIVISRVGYENDMLPSAHTCFNNLILPDYQNKEKTKKSILIAINNSEGFGLI